MPGVGASAFPSDPALNPRDHPALWSPDAAPDVVIVEVADPSLVIPLQPDAEPLVETASIAERNLASARMRYARFIGILQTSSIN